MKTLTVETDQLMTRLSKSLDLSFSQYIDDSIIQNIVLDWGEALERLEDMALRIETDPDDNNLKAEPNDLIVLVGTGIEGEARFKLEVTYALSNGGYEVWDGSWKHVVE